MMTANIALQITIDSPCRNTTDDLKKGLIINGETGRIEQMDEKSGAIEKRFYTDDLLQRSDKVIDTVTITYSILYKEYNN